jgi:YVTN family beta-propeller protein
MNHNNKFLLYTCALILMMLSASVFAVDPPERQKSRFALKTGYLEQAEEGIYELAFDNQNHKVFAAAMDRVNRADNKGYLYAFSPGTLAVEGKYPLPFRAFSVEMNNDAGRVYIGHTQAASLRISMANAASGKVIKTSDRLSVHVENAADPRYEHLRHMVYSKAANALFVSYSNMVKAADGMKPVHKLLVLDGTSLKRLGEVVNAYKDTAYGLALDELTQKVYVGGKDYINEIDPVTKQVLRTISLNNARPKITSLQSLTVDSRTKRIFAVIFDHDDRSGTNDGLYVFDLENGRQLAYVHTGAGANAVKYNPKYNEVYVTNFTSGTLSIVDAGTYRVKKEISTPVYPNQMTLSADLNTLYVGVKEGFNRQWDPDVFVEGAKERILSVSLNES